MKKYYQQFFGDQGEIEHWDSIYDKQDFYGECYRQRMATALLYLDALSLSENSRILEAGCGAGRFAKEAAKRGCRIFGMDYSHGMLVKASGICNREDKQTAAFFQGDIESLPLKDSSFDVIVCLGVISYLKSEVKALDELARVLKPGGVLILSIVNKARLVKRLDLPLLLTVIVKKILNGLFPSRKKGAENKDPSLTTYFIPKIRKSLERAGFAILEYRTVPLELLTFLGRELYPRKMALKITLFFEQFSNIPMIGSFGSMCVFKAEKNSFKLNEARTRLGGGASVIDKNMLHL